MSVHLLRIYQGSSYWRKRLNRRSSGDTCWTSPGRTEICSRKYACERLKKIRLRKSGSRKPRLGPAKGGPLELTLVLGPCTQRLPVMVTPQPWTCVCHNHLAFYIFLSNCISMQVLSLEFLQKFSTCLGLIGILLATFFYSYGFPSCAPLSR